MKIGTLAFEHFRAHAGYALQLDPLTVIVGPNGSGKTTIQLGLEWLFAGKCAISDDRGKGAELATRGHARGSVTAITGDASASRDTDGKLSLSWTRAGQQDAQRELEAHLCCSGDRARLCLRAGRFFGLDAKAQAGLLAELLHLHPTAALVRDELAKLEATSGLPVQALVQDLVGADIANLPKAYKACYDERTVANRDAKRLEARLAELEAAGQSIAYVSSDEMQKRTQAVQEAEAAVSAASADLSAAEREQARVRHLGAKLAEARQAVAVAESALADAPSKTLEQAQADKAKIQAALQDRRDSLAKAMEQVGWAEADLKRYHEATARVESCKRQVQCVEQQFTDAGCPQCGYQTDAFAGILADAKASLAAAGASPHLKLEPLAIGEMIAHLKASVADLQDRVGRGETALRQADNLVSTLAGLARQQADLAAKRARVAELEAEAVASPDNTEMLAAALATAKASLAAAREAQADGQRWARHSAELTAAKTDLAATKTRQAVLQELVALFREDGLGARLLRDGLEPFEASLNQTLARFGLAARHATDLSLEVQVGDAWVPYHALSDGEQVVVGLAHQVAFATLTGLRIVVVDRLEALDDKRQELLIQACKALEGEEGEVDHIILLGVRCVPTEGVRRIQLDLATDLVEQLSGAAA